MAETTQDNKVQLGCGTLIVIAIIVAIFSGGRDSSRLEKEVRELRQTVERLETKIDDMSKRLNTTPVLPERPPAPTLIR